MAKVKNGFAGSFQGKLGAITGVKRFGNFYVRQSITRNDSNTKAQAAHREHFRDAVASIRIAAKAFKIGFARLTGDGKSAYNAAFAYNYKRIQSGSSVLRPQDMVVSVGMADGPQSCTVDNPDDGIIKFIPIFDVEHTSVTNDDDVFGVLINAGASAGNCVIGTAKVVDGAITMGFPGSWTGVTVHAYVFVRSALTGDVSASQYLGTVNCN